MKKGPKQSKNRDCRGPVWDNQLFNSEQPGVPRLAGDAQLLHAETQKSGLWLVVRCGKENFGSFLQLLKWHLASGCLIQEK